MIKDSRYSTGCPLVSLITVNYNGLHDTCEMIDSFRKYETYPYYEIIVVDNGSHQSEAQKIQKRYKQTENSTKGSASPHIKVVQNINNGFAGGNNAGVKAAQGDYLFFINNDTLIKEPILETLVRRMESDPRRNGGVSPMLKFASQPDILQYAGFTPLSPITLRNTSIGFMQQDGPRFHSSCETASLHGAAMMVSRKALQDAGPMTEIYFLFYEELDWSIQIKKAGYRLWYEPAAVIYHKERHDGAKGNTDAGILPITCTRTVCPQKPTRCQKVPFMRLSLHPRHSQESNCIFAAWTSCAGKSYCIWNLQRLT